MAVRDGGGQQHPFLETAGNLEDMRMLCRFVGTFERLVQQCI